MVAEASRVDVLERCFLTKVHL